MIFFLNTQTNLRALGIIVWAVPAQIQISGFLDMLEILVWAYNDLT